jgi:hypothetical protein
VLRLTASDELYYHIAAAGAGKLDERWNVFPENIAPDHFLVISCGIDSYIADPDAKLFAHLILKVIEFH